MIESQVLKIQIEETIQRPYLEIIVIEEGEKIQVKSPETIFIKIIEENLANLKKMHINVQGSYSVPNRLDKKRNFTQCVIIKTPNKQNNERI